MVKSLLGAKTLVRGMAKYPTGPRFMVRYLMTGLYYQKRKT